MLSLSLWSLSVWSRGMSFSSQSRVVIKLRHKGCNTWLGFQCQINSKYSTQTFIYRTVLIRGLWYISMSSYEISSYNCLSKYVTSRQKSHYILWKFRVYVLVPESAAKIIENGYTKQYLHTWYMYMYLVFVIYVCMGMAACKFWNALGLSNRNKMDMPHQWRHHASIIQGRLAGPFSLVEQAEDLGERERERQSNVKTTYVVKILWYIFRFRAGLDWEMGSLKRAVSSQFINWFNKWEILYAMQWN